MPLIDMGQAEIYEAIPAGTYDAHLSAWEWISVEDSTNAKDPYLKLEFTIDEGEYANRKLWRNFSAAPKALVYMKKALIALGADAGDVAESFDTDEVMPDLVGNACRLKVDTREYEEELQNEVKRVLPAA